MERIRMKQELEYFYIEDSFGGNQDWFTDYWMHIGGCAAAAACDSCIALEKAGIGKNLYPFDIHNLNRLDYIDFAMQMKPYLRPRWSGIDKLDIYVDGFWNYLRDVGNQDLKMEAFPVSESVQVAADRVRHQIDHKYPIPFLLLRHKNKAFKELLWHWFMLTGYEQREDGLYVKVTTYGSALYYPFEVMWSSGYENNGGMILYG